MARRWKSWALVLVGLMLGAAMMIAGPGSATSWPPSLAPLSDEDQLGLYLSGPACVGVVEVLQRAPDSGPHGEYTEYLDVRPIRWFAGPCGTKKMRLHAAPTSAFGFLSTGHWEVGVHDTVIVFAYLDKGRAFISQSPFTLWNGLAPATPERIQFLEANVPRVLKSQSLDQLAIQASAIVTARVRRMVECQRNGAPTRCLSVDVLSVLAGRSCGDSILVFDPLPSRFRADTSRCLLFLAEPESCLYRVIGWKRGNSPIVNGTLPALDGMRYEDVVAAIRTARHANAGAH